MHPMQLSEEQLMRHSITSKKKSKQGSNNLGDNCSNRDNVRLLILFKTGQSQHHSSTRVIGILK